MRGIPVLFNNNHTSVVLPNELDSLLEAGSLRAFRRMTGWVIVGQDPVRGRGGTYEGRDRRRQRTRLCVKSMSMPRGVLADTTQVFRSCLTCPNLVNGKCVSTASME